MTLFDRLRVNFAPRTGHVFIGVFVISFSSEERTWDSLTAAPCAIHELFFSAQHSKGLSWSVGLAEKFMSRRSVTDVPKENRLLTA
jgi:hypothetical protein